MAENPLLPNAELLALRALLRKAFEAPEDAQARSGARVVRGREALFAATLMQLRPADCLLLPSAELGWARSLLASRKQSNPDLLVTTSVPFTVPRLLTAAGIAAGMMRAQGSDAVVFATVSSIETDPGWQEAIRWAVAESLPLIVACTDPSGAEAFQPQQGAPGERLAWPALRKLSTAVPLPVLTVDGDDAVAVYRTMQESVLRARARGGPAMLWAVLPSAPERNRTRPPALRRLEEYLAVRDIAG